MYRQYRLFIFAALVVLLTPTNGLTAKYSNKDTAKNRQDYTTGTRPKEGSSEIILGQDPQSGDTVMQVIPPEKEERDWYENMFLYIDVDAGAGDVPKPPDPAHPAPTPPAPTTAPAK